MVLGPGIDARPTIGHGRRGLNPVGTEFLELYSQGTFPVGGDGEVVGDEGGGGDSKGWCGCGAH